MTINDWKIFDNKKQPEIYFEVTNKALQPGNPISCFFEIEGNSAIEKPCRVYILARKTNDSEPFLYATTKGWSAFSTSIGSLYPQPYFDGLVPDVPSEYYRSYFDLPPLPEGNWLIEVILEVEQTVLMTSSESQVSVQEEKVIPVKPTPPSWPDIFPPIPDDPKPEPTPEPSSPPTDGEDLDKTPKPWTNKAVGKIKEAKLPKDWMRVSFGPWEYRIFKFSGKMGPEKGIQVHSTPYVNQPRTVHLLVKKGAKPSINDFNRTWKAEPSDWDFRSSQYLPKKSLANVNLYWKYNIGSQSELVKCYNVIEVEDIFYVMLYNYGPKSVDQQILILSNDGK
jgi:hypothetical protein